MKAAIFDMDGTLTDSMYLWDNIGARYLQDVGITPPDNLFEALKSLNISQTAAYFRSLGSPDDEHAVRRRLNGMVADSYFHVVPEKAGSLAYLKQLRAQGVKLCVLTATDHRLAEAALRRLGLHDQLDFLFSCSDIGCGKDSPAAFERVQQELGVPVADTVVFEDALYAIRTAKEAGYRVVAIADKSSADDEPQIRQLADRFICHYSELQECEVCSA